jgi:predicted nucleic acid-binding protein
VIFIDTNVFMYAVGRSHPLRQEVRRFFAEAVAGAQPRLCTSAEVLQELLHPYLPVARLETLDAALELAEGCISEWWATRYRNRTPPTASKSGGHRPGSPRRQFPIGQENRP